MKISEAIEIVHSVGGGRKAVKYDAIKSGIVILTRTADDGELSSRRLYDKLMTLPINQILYAKGVKVESIEVR